AASGDPSSALNFVPKAFGTYTLSIRGTTASGATLTSAPVTVSAILADWQWRNPLPFGATLNDAVRVGNKWWLGGTAGLLATLDDAGNATRLQSPIGFDFHAISYANGRFVIGGSGYNNATQTGQPCLWASTDGTSWTPWAAGAYTYPYGIAY